MATAKVEPMKRLHISEDLSLPVDSITQTFAILAKRRVGKTYTASVMAEEMVRAGLPFVVLDPTGAWWGLRASADGKSEGLPVIIVGGSHGDVPLEPTAGKVIADLIVAHPGFYIIDLSATNSNAEQDKFAMEFGERLYRRKDKERSPLHLFIDEADAFMPQKPMPGQQRMLGAYEALIRRGGIRGIGVTLITQRPAVLNKNLLNMTEVIIALQTTAPLDQDAVRDWVKRNGTTEQVRELMSSLASLQQSEAWIYSPAWLEIFQRVKIRERRTFNSSATPRAGERFIEPKKLAPVDLDQLRDQIAATIEQAKADDPKELRRQILDLQKQLKARPVEKVVEPKIERVEVPIIDEKLVSLLRDEARELKEQAEKLNRLSGDINAMLFKLSLFQGEEARKMVRSVQPAPTAQPKREAPKPGTGNGSAALSKCARALLSVVLQFPQGVTKSKLALVSGYSKNSSTFGNGLSELRKHDYISGSDPLRATESAQGAIDWEPLPAGKELIEYWKRRVSKCAGSLFSVIIEAYPNPVSKEALSEATGYSKDSSTFGNGLSELRTLEIIERGDIKASDVFFE